MKLLISILLLIIAILIKWLLFPFAIAYTFARIYKVGGWKGGNEWIAVWIKDIAISQDRLGNVMYQVPFNDSCLNPSSKAYFGNGKETISAVLGKAKSINSLKITGKILVTILNLLDKNHVENALKNNE